MHPCLAIRRLQYQEAYYTEGNVPETMVALPEKFGPDQVAEFQRLFDDLDSLEIKRRIRMMPGGTELLTTKDAALKDATDEWVARVICWVFQVPASALITENNRATAQTAREANLQDGLLPFMDYIKALVDDLIEDFLGIDDVEFVWEQDESLDSKEQADVDAIYLDRGVIQVNEVRKRLGYEPLETTQQGAQEGKEVPLETALDAQIGQESAQNGNKKPVETPSNAVDATKKPGETIEDPTAAAIVDSGKPVQDLALNGAQVTSLVSILTQVSSGALPADTARAIISAAFPGLSETQVGAMVDPLKNFKPASDEPAPEVPAG